MTTLTRDAGHYGLSLILGGGEGTLYEITSMYAGMARTYLGLQKEFPLSDRVALWHTMEALKEVNRPDEIDWHLISSVRKAAWKTGTSYGFRDAWAVGVTPDWAVGVWAGNAGGQGVPGLTGARTAGPVLFELLGILPESAGWFPEPDPAEGVMADVCTLSGHLKGLHCDASERVLLPVNGLRTAPCPYHREFEGKSAFVLPPAMEWYYKPHHPEYRTPTRTPDAIGFIYPEPGSTVYLPRQLDGSVPGIVLQVAHRDPGATLWWHLDQDYLGETKFVHKMSVAPAPGRHTATVVDADGRTVSVSFTVSE
jgi:penicillin-binding protein 1C